MIDHNASKNSDYNEVVTYFYKFYPFMHIRSQTTKNYIHKKML